MSEYLLPPFVGAPEVNRVYNVGALDLLRACKSGSVDCIVTSPPYWNLRDYGTPGQYGLEPTPNEFVHNLVVLFREARRVLKDSGTLWVNIASSYAGSGKGGNPPGSEWSGFVGNNAREKSAKVGATVVASADEPYALRDDLTPDEMTYVLSELAAFRKGGEVASPDLPINVDQAVTPLTSGEKV